MSHPSLGVLAQVSAQPSSTGMPGADLLQQLINWLAEIAVLRILRVKRGDFPSPTALLAIGPIPFIRHEALQGHQQKSPSELLMHRTATPWKRVHYCMWELN